MVQCFHIQHSSLNYEVTVYDINKETGKRRHIIQKPSGNNIVESRQTLNIGQMLLAKSTIGSYHYLDKNKLVGGKKMTIQRCEIGWEYIEQ